MRAALYLRQPPTQQPRIGGSDQGQATHVAAAAFTCKGSPRLPAMLERPGGRSVDRTFQIRHRIAASLLQYSTRSTACSTTLQGPCSITAVAVLGDFVP